TLSEQHALPAVAVGSVLMHSASRKPLQDALTAIRHNTSVEQLGLRLEPNAEQHLRALPELQRRYPAALLQESLRIARRCHFCLSELQYDYPPEVVPPGLDAGDYLRHLVLEGARQRWPSGLSPRWQAQIDHELALIRELNYEHYFLTVYDIVAFARARGILCQGRGSAANSVVCYCLFITEVPPDRVSLLFERFISRERASEPPDIDVDFEHERREEVIQYIYKKYSRERAALAATLICYKPRSAVRDIGRALGLDAGFIQQLSGSLAWWDRRNELEQRCREQGMPANSPLIRLFARLVLEIQGFPRHLSQHVGGFVITRSPISHLVPVENAAMPERTVIQWDKESLEALGLLKVDILALGMLSAIRKCLQLIGRHQGRPLTMQAILREEDPAVYDMLCRADCVGVFQVESRAQMAMLPRLRPRNYYDLVVQVAIVRPGPIQGNMVHPYLRQRERQRAGQPLEVLSDDPAVQAVLARTHGIPIFQEQVIKLAMVAAGFSPGEADRLRRAMGSWGKNGDLDGFRHRLVAGMLERGHDAAFAERLFEQMRGFGAYGFPESHAASFALLVYVSAWLKCHHPAAFYCALLNSQPMGFYSPSQLIQDARRHGIRVRPVDVCHSDWDHSLEPGPGTGPALRLGLRLVKHLGPQAAARLLAARASQPFASQPDLHRRADLARAELQALVEADALSGLSGHRRQAHWRALVIDPSEDAAGGEADDGVALAPADAVAELSADYAATGLSLRGHPMSLLRERHALFRRCKSHAELAALNHGRFVRIAGVVTGRQRPGSASGVVFLTLEDETGNT
ncbi:MAG TPA: error-prone DNA polymerase, partial [Spongiibacteraceae bacterium]|nr:error-prone DNA polymerase [Spongiibacteraceae bacterium]